jgi:hypothetical protein
VGLVNAIEVSMYVYVCNLTVSNPTIRMLVAYNQYPMNWHQTQASAVALAVALVVASGVELALRHRQVSIYTLVPYIHLLALTTFVT